MTKTRITSPLLVFVVLLAVFELTVRLPYGLYVLSDPSYGQMMQMHYFSIFPPWQVITLGLIILSLTMGALLLAGAINGRYRTVGGAAELPEIPGSVHIIALACFASVVLAIIELGPAAVAEEISGKRSELEEIGILWVLLKLSNFNHLIACMYFIRMHQRGRTIDKVGFGLAIALLAVASIVFSQRAILVSFILEIFYLQIVFGTFRLSRLLKLLVVMVPVLLSISILRPSTVFLSFGEAVLFGLEKVVQSRYFFDILKLGTVMTWDSQQDWVGPLSIGFALEPFIPDAVMFYKEIGPLISKEVYLMPTSAGGVTTGGLLEATMSFGIVGGILFFATIFYVFLRFERQLIVRPRRRLDTTLILLLLISKFSLLVNSSLGAFAFQFLLELAILWVLLVTMWLLAELSPRRWRRQAWA